MSTPPALPAPTVQSATSPPVIPALRGAPATSGAPDCGHSTAAPSSARSEATRRSQAALLAAAGVFLFLIGCYAWDRLVAVPRPVDRRDTDALDSRKPRAGPARESLAHRIDLNQASADELQLVRGIGPATADAIVGYRDQHGPFRTVDELDRVPGIGPKTVEKLRPRLFVASPTAAVEPVATDSPAPFKSAGKRQPDQPIDLNRATREELMQLPGIGPVKADAILADRDRNGPFQRPEDVMRIPGIKQKTFEKLRPHVYVGEVN